MIACNGGQLKEDDYNICIDVSTKASIKEIIIPGIIVIFSPILFGVFFGPKAVAGYLAGIVDSAVQMAISASNSGGAWVMLKNILKKRI